MKLLLIEDDVVEYAKHILNRSCHTGHMGTDELEIATALHLALVNAKEIDFSKLGAATLDALNEKGMTLGFADQVQKAVTALTSRTKSLTSRDPEPINFHTLIRG